MPEPTVIVTFDVTEPNLGSCLESLARQRDGHHNRDHMVQSGEVTAEVLLVPFRGREEPVSESEAVGEEQDEDTEEDPDGHDDVREAEEQNDETVEAGEDALAVAAAFAADPPERMRVRLLGGDPATDVTAARRRGGQEASGSHLLFLEGRDALTAYALSYLWRTADDTHSDLVVGNVHWFNELGASPSKTHKKLCAKQRFAEDPRAVPALAADPVLGNKLWRREFWLTLTDHGMHPDDTDLDLRRCALSARTVDVLPGPVLLMRERHDTALPLDKGVLTRRLTAMNDLAADLAGEDRRLWDRTLLQGELQRLLLRFQDADAEVRETVVDLLNAHLDHVPAAQLNDLNVLERLLYHLVRKRRTDDVVEVATFAKSVEIKNARVHRRGLAYYIGYPFFESEDPAKAVPREIFRLDDELRVRQKTEDIRWEEGRLHISGRIGIRHLRARKRWQQHLMAFAVNTVDRRRVRVPVRVRLAAEYRLPDVPEAARHDYGGFTVVLDPAKLRVAGRWEPGEWKIELTVFNRGLTRRKALSSPVTGAPERPGYQQVAPEVWVRPRWSGDRHLIVAVESTTARVDAHTFDGDTGILTLQGETVTEAASGATQLRLTRRPGTAVLSYPITVEGGRFSVGIGAEDLFGRAVTECGGVIRQEEWDVHLVDGDQRTATLVLPDDVPTAAYASDTDHLELSVQRTSAGHLKLRAGQARCVIDEARWEGRDLHLKGEFTADAELGLLARARGRDEEHVLDVERSGTRFAARLSPADMETLSGTLSLAVGGYQLWGRVAGDDGRTFTTGVEFSDDLVGDMPLEMKTDERSFTLTSHGQAVPVLQVGSDLHPSERGSFAQRRLKEVDYPAQRQEPVVDGVLFDTYTGRQYSDSPQSIYAELRTREGWTDYPMSWLVADGRVNLPEDLGRVRHRGREYYEALARSRFLVTNSRQPVWFHRHPDQTVVQTWHGSMLKRIGFDVENIRGKSRDYFDKLAWETRQWDYLVSPSPWATPILRSAFRFEGEILETGYPRNDIFFSPHREAVAERTRRVLGLPEGKKVVLYAPTWRDDKYYTRGKHKLDLHLDLQRMYDQLGDDHVLLVRRHPRVVDSVPIVGRDFVYDVSLYPEIQELFLITDVLVTDYSSMMFDFANTGRPMLFFTYDLDSYRDNLRGFYFDFEETAPGPLLTESDQVIESLRNIGEVAEQAGPAYRSFVDRFCPLDDGHAAARVVDRVFGQG